MVKLGNDVLFQEPMVTHRRLRRSVVIAETGDTISVRFIGEPFAFEPDQEVLMYFNGKREFMQQIGRIVEIQGLEAEEPAASDPGAQPASPAPSAKEAGRKTATGREAASAGKDLAKKEDAKDKEKEKEGPVFVIEPVGDPISAESRQTYRVSTISAGIVARMGSEQGLQVQDLSATGLAVLADHKYPLGHLVEIAVKRGDESCHGQASIQSVRELESGRFRYGLRAIEEDPHAQIFLATLQRISFAVQREQLKRSGGVR